MVADMVLEATVGFLQKDGKLGFIIQCGLWQLVLVPEIS
jgi:hypothetical protein